VLNGRRSLLVCDGVGVGKTISAGYILTHLTSQAKVGALVVCPPSLQEKWRLELHSKFEFRIVPVRSPAELDAVGELWNGSVSAGRLAYVMPSSLLGRVTPQAFKGPVVIDEIHNYRNADTNSWRAARELTKWASHRIGLSATPINNRLEDLAAELALLLQLDRFVSEAIVADLWRPDRRSSLYPLVTRFSKEQLGIHFAHRDIKDVHIPCPSEYRRKVVEAVKVRRQRPISEAMFRDEVTYFRLAASSPNAFERSIGVRMGHKDDKQRYLATLLRRHQEDRVVVFAEFEETAQVLAEFIEGRSGFLITGSVPVFAREEIISRFRESSNGVLIMTSVGGEGLDLQCASILVNYDLTWNPMILEQRIGRIDRIGQEKDQVTVYNFMLEGSIDERIVQVLGRKLGLVTGSVLEPSSVLGDSWKTEDGLFLEEDLNEELRKADMLARSLELSRAIIPDDYDILGSIDVSYCDVEKLAKAGTDRMVTPWFQENAESTEWKQRLGEAAERLSYVIQTYS